VPWSLVVAIALVILTLIAYVWALVAATAWAGRS
jgi:hypothetical protein